MPNVELVIGWRREKELHLWVYGGNEFYCYSVIPLAGKWSEDKRAQEMLALALAELFVRAELVAQTAYCLLGTTVKGLAGESWAITGKTLGRWIDNFARLMKVHAEFVPEVKEPPAAVKMLDAPEPTVADEDEDDDDEQRGAKK
jgi:hypothetical protein